MWGVNVKLTVSDDIINCELFTTRHYEGSMNCRFHLTMICVFTTIRCWINERIIYVSDWHFCCEWSIAMLCLHHANTVCKLYSRNGTETKLLSHSNPVHMELISLPVTQVLTTSMPVQLVLFSCVFFVVLRKFSVGLCTWTAPNAIEQLSTGYESTSCHGPLRWISSEII